MDAESNNILPVFEIYINLERKKKVEVKNRRTANLYHMVPSSVKWEFSSVECRAYRACIGRVVL